MYIFIKIQDNIKGNTCSIKNCGRVERKDLGSKNIDFVVLWLFIQLLYIEISEDDSYNSLERVRDGR